MVIAVGAAIWSRNPLVWAMVIVLAGFVAFSAFSIDITTNVVAQQNTTYSGTNAFNTYSYISHTTIGRYPSIVYLNTAVGSIGILMFFLDLFDMWKTAKREKEEE